MGTHQKLWNKEAIKKLILFRNLILYDRRTFTS